MKFTALESRCKHTFTECSLSCLAAGTDIYQTVLQLRISTSQECFVGVCMCFWICVNLHVRGWMCVNVSVRQPRFSFLHKEQSCFKQPEYHYSFYTAWYSLFQSIYKSLQITAKQPTIASLSITSTDKLPRQEAHPTHLIPYFHTSNFSLQFIKAKWQKH